MVDQQCWLVSALECGVCVGGVGDRDEHSRMEKGEAERRFSSSDSLSAPRNSEVDLDFLQSCLVGRKSSYIFDKPAF